MSFKKSLRDGGYTLFVSTDSMGEKAVKMKKICSELIIRINRAKALVTSTDNIWSSQSADFMREAFNAEIRDSDLLEKKLNDTIGDLEAIITHYKFTEKENADEAGCLPDSVIH